MGESQKSLWVISGSPSYGFNPVSEGVSAVATRDRHVFFKLKKITSNFFVLKPGEKSFSLWPAWIRFDNVVHMHIARADSDVGFRRLEAIQVCIFVE